MLKKVYLVVICFITTLVFSACKESTDKKVIKLLVKGDYESVCTIYNELDDSEDINIVDNMIINHCDELLDNYREDALSYENLLDKYESIKKIGVHMNTKIEENLKIVEDIESSRKAYIKGKEFYNQGNFYDAITQYRKVTTTDKITADAENELNNSIEKYRQTMLDEASSLADNKEYDKAINHINVAINMIGEDKKLLETRSIYEEDKNTFLAEDMIKMANEYASTGDYDLAMNKLEDAKDLIGDDDQINDLYIKFTDLNNKNIKDNAISKANDLSKAGDYLSAAKIISEAQKKVENDTELNSIYQQCMDEYENSIMLVIDQSLEESKYQDALITIDKAILEISDTTSLDVKRESICNQYTEYILKEVDSMVTERNYSEAMRYIENAMVYLPDNAELENKQIEIESKKPMDLTQMKLLNDCDTTFNEEITIDYLGNEYINVTNVIANKYDGWGRKKNAYAEYYLNKKYKTLTATVATGQEFWEGATNFVKIYADDQLIYTSQAITQKTKSFTINVDINYCDFIKIEFPDDNSVVLFMDAMLYVD